MQRTRQILRNLPPAFLAIFLLVIYLRSMAPGLSWANNGADGGDLITAAATGGVPHPGGYPFYILLAQAFQLIPNGSLAWRTNLLSAAAAVLAALAVYFLAARMTASPEGKPGWLPGLASGFALGLSPLFWSQAVITEVYTVQAMLTALILSLAIAPFPRAWEVRLDCLRGLLLGLALGGHATSLLLLPVLPASSRSKAAFLRHLVFLAAGSLVYLVLPLRALSNPPVNWGDPVTPARFWWLLSGQLYRDSLFAWVEGGAWPRIQAWAAMLMEQFGAIGLLAGIGGLVFFTPARARSITVYIAGAFSLFAIVFGTNDSFVYLLPAFVVFAAWIGLAAGGMMRLVPRVGWGGPALLLFSFFALATLNYPRVDASRDVRAETFGVQVLREAPPNAIIFVRGDRAVFTLWYFHLALHKRPDLVVIARDLLHFDWYQETLRSIYPTLQVPGPLPWAEEIIRENAGRAVCFVEYMDRTMIDCSER